MLPLAAPTPTHAALHELHLAPAAHAGEPLRRPAQPLPSAADALCLRLHRSHARHRRQGRRGSVPQPVRRRDGTRLARARFSEPPHGQQRTSHRPGSSRHRRKWPQVQRRHPSVVHVHRQPGAEPERRQLRRRRTHERPPHRPRPPAQARAVLRALVAVALPAHAPGARGRRQPEPRRHPAQREQQHHARRPVFPFH